MEQVNVKEEKGSKLSAFLGTAIIILGLLLNRSTLEQTLVPDGEITSLLYRVVIFASQLGLVGLGLYVLVKRPRIRLANLFLAVSSCLFALLLSELILQVFYNPPPLVSGWRSRVSTFEKNQIGFRGQPIDYSDDDFVIVLLGDSHVEAQACAYGWMPERRLQHYLNSHGKKVKVFTVGAGGYGQDQQLLVLQEYYQKYRSDLVVLWQSPANDVWNNMFPTHWPTNGTPKPTFWLQDGKLLGPSEQMGEELEAPFIRLFALLQSRITFVDRDKEWEKYLPEPYTPMNEYDGAVNYEWQERWNMNLGLMRDENFENGKTHMALWLTPRSKRMKYGLELTRRLLHEIDTLVTSHNGQFVIFNKSTPESHATPDEQVYVLNGKYYSTSMEQGESNLKYIDGDFQFYTIPITIEDWRVGPEDGHPNEHAVDQLMRDLAHHLKSLIPDRKDGK